MVLVVAQVGKHGPRRMRKAQSPRRCLNQSDDDVKEASDGCLKCSASDQWVCAAGLSGFHMAREVKYGFFILKDCDVIPVVVSLDGMTDCMRAVRYHGKRP